MISLFNKTKDSLKKSVVTNFMNCARMKFFRKIYSLQDYRKKQKYDLIKAIMLKFKMPIK